MHTQKVLIISVSGIGNTILQSPLINTLLDQGSFSVDVLFRDQAVQSVFQFDERIQKKYTLPKGLINTIKFILELRRNKYEYSVACFPSNQIGFHLLAFLVGAKKRIIHQYKIGKWQTLSFLSNVKVPTSITNHDVEQNLNLLKAFNVAPSQAQKNLIFSTSSANNETAENFFKENDLNDKKVIGIHPGCKLSEQYRRWPKNKFTDLIDRLNDDDVHCLLFAGPDEEEYTEEIYNSLKDPSKNTLVKENNLNNIGSIIAKCHSFLSTDSGLGHIAVAKNVNTLAIFGPANQGRTAPYGSRGEVISLNLDCSPCMGYPFTQTHSRIHCPIKFKCLNDLTVEAVYLRIKNQLSNG